VNGGSAFATATGGRGSIAFNTIGNGGSAAATANSTAMLGGTANATATGGTPGANCCSAITGIANASSFAATINGYIAQAQSTATGSSGQAQATAQTNFGSVNSIQTIATSQIGGGATGSAFAQVGNGASLPSAINPGQSFSVINPITVGPVTLAVGSMGAGGVGSSLAYQQTANFTFNATRAPFLIDLFSNASIGKGFDTATFKISDNGNLVLSKSFSDLISAQAFFSNNNLLAIQLAGGLNNVQIAFNETMSGGEGFSFNFGTVSPSATPLPPAWTMMLMGIAGFGFVAFRRKSKQALMAA
jgi:hypothetical protein